jgi:hypothetical protein
LFILARAFEGGLFTHDESVPSLIADRHRQPRLENMRLYRKIRQLTAIVYDFGWKNDLLRHNFMGDKV